jgi:membrane-bound lytic murein transglycosylase D
MGSAAVINTRLTEQGLDDLAPLSHYGVKKGETLASIAKKLRVSRSDLAEANYLSTKSRLQTGQRLIIPRAPALLAAARTTDPSPAPQPDAVRAARTDASPVEVAPAPVRTEAPTRVRTKSTHRVARGETLFSIAKRYGTTVAVLKELNNLRGNVIKVGQRLVIERLSTLATN